MSCNQPHNTFCSYDHSPGPTEESWIPFQIQVSTMYILGSLQFMIFALLIEVYANAEIDLIRVSIGINIYLQLVHEIWGTFLHIVEEHRGVD